ncbi:MAG: thiamine-monophosphate kinase [bacterium P3]|nr:MAG: thiamine-monophosphate kinase [bacterium P3]KWW40756.1 MAG: thiamine-monophosphate kinase [bacterium F083]
MEHTKYQEGRTELAELGKFALIDRLTEGFSARQKSTVMGVGDDCAVLGGGRRKMLVTTETLAEGVTFDMMYTPLKHLGYKAVAVSLSNIAAMNGTARQIVVSIAVSNRYSVEALEELYAGIRLCCERYDVDLAGGDTTSSRSGMVISVTAIGDVESERICYRKGAGLHDLICVSGDLGSAYSGLLVLEREKATYQANPGFQPELDGYDYVLERYLKPEPRFDIVQLLREKGITPTAMIDVSDGLASELLHICKQSRCGCEVYEERIPVDYQTSRVCSEMSKNMLPVSNALNGGKDYELLFTVKTSDYEKIKDCESVHIIGHITDGAPVMVTPQNSTIELRAQGWTAQK